VPSEISYEIQAQHILILLTESSNMNYEFSYDTFDCQFRKGGKEAHTPGGISFGRETV